MNNNTPGVKPPETIDLTKCQPGDRLRLRNGNSALYLEATDGPFPHVIRPEFGSTASATDGGSIYGGYQCQRDVVAIVRPTRAELTAQRDELLSAIKWAIGEMQGDSGTGDSYWNTSPHYRAALKAIARAEDRT